VITNVAELSLQAKLALDTEVAEVVCTMSDTRGRSRCSLWAQLYCASTRTTVNVVTASTYRLVRTWSFAPTPSKAAGMRCP